MRVHSIFFSVVLSTVSLTSSLAQAPTFTLPTYTSQQRWARASELGIASTVVALMQAKERGVSAEAYGRELFKAFGPPRGWANASTPFALFRGMYNNIMSHPQQQCDILEASERLVKAECNRPYAASVRNRESSYGVTLDEYDAAFRVFAQSIAEYHKMTWRQEVRLDNLVITIEKP
jgi:hypothetical protein